jgi:transposase
VAAGKPSPSGASDQRRAFVAPDLAPVREDPPPRRSPLREACKGPRYIVKTGGQWRYVVEPTRRVQEATGDSVAVAFVDPAASDAVRAS